MSTLPLFLILFDQLIPNSANVDIDHFSSFNLHNWGHTTLGDHHGDYDYDHEAFLGVDDAREFDQLPPEESKARLGKIVDRIDSNEDGYVTLDEMRDWIRFTQQRYISEDVDRQWNQHNVDNKETMSWEEYRTLVYGFLDEDLSDGHQDEDTITYQ